LLTLLYGIFGKGNPDLDGFHFQGLKPKFFGLAVFGLHLSPIHIERPDDLAFDAVIVYLECFLSLLIVPLIPFVQALAGDSASTPLLHEPLASHQVLIMCLHPKEALGNGILHKPVQQASQSLHQDRVLALKLLSSHPCVYLTLLIPGDISAGLGSYLSRAH